ncbi:uncharacterized protein I206_105372 [Kwoniella pini CBS 10737]|uniref:Uncharacterized protein n=1 Tax=Kwoniella pini CBS 10737 TaxID=1296096 RepID=A0AAJ8MPT3_9TREE
MTFIHHTIERNQPLCRKDVENSLSLSVRIPSDLTKKKWILSLRNSEDKRWNKDSYYLDLPIFPFKRDGVVQTRLANAEKSLLPTIVPRFMERARTSILGLCDDDDDDDDTNSQVRRHRRGGYNIPKLANKVVVNSALISRITDDLENALARRRSSGETGRGSLNDLDFKASIETDGLVEDIHLGWTSEDRGLGSFFDTEHFPPRIRISDLVGAGSRRRRLDAASSQWSE